MRPQAPQAGTYDPNAEALTNAEWYWGRLTRDAARNILAKKPDGSFLVRDALSKDGEYTLTLVKGGTEKLIKICQNNGKFGFVDCIFDSVVDLIEYYRKNSLSLYNRALDITLKYPISHNVYDDEEQQPVSDLRALAEEYLKINTQVEQKEQWLDHNLKVFKDVEAKLNESKLQQDVFQRADKLFQNQRKKLETLIATQPPVGNDGGVNNALRQQEQQKLQNNAQMLRSLHSNLANEMGKHNEFVQTRKEEYKELERAINAARPQLQEMQNQKDKFKLRLLALGINEDDIKMITEIGFNAWQQRWDRFRNQPHNIESLWLMTECVRQDAEDLLQGAPTGTFLIRPRSAGHYALSINCNSATHHCIIYETESGFGFAAPYNIYSTLKKLVEHYSTNSLEEHNDTLTTTLRIPVLHWHQNREAILQDEIEFEQQQQDQQREADQEAADLLPSSAREGLEAEVEGGGGEATGIVEGAYDNAGAAVSDTILNGTAPPPLGSSSLLSSSSSSPPPPPSSTTYPYLHDNQ